MPPGRADGIGSGPLSAYVAKCNAKFSDAMRDNLLNEADGDAIAISVLMRYKPLEPEMVLHLLNHRFRQMAFEQFHRW